MERKIESKLTIRQALDVVSQIDVRVKRVKDDIKATAGACYTADMLESPTNRLKELEIFQLGFSIGAGVLPPDAVGPYSRLMAGIVIKDEATLIAENVGQ